MKEAFLYEQFGSYLKPEHVGSLVIKYAADPSSERLNGLMNMCFNRNFWIVPNDFKAALIAAAQNGCSQNIQTLVEAWDSYSERDFLVLAYSEALATAVNRRNHSNNFFSALSACNDGLARVAEDIEKGQNKYDSAVAVLARSIQQRTQNCTQASQAILGQALIEAVKGRRNFIIKTLTGLKELLPVQSCIDAATEALQNDCTDAFDSLLKVGTKTLSEEIAMKFGQIACQKKNFNALKAIVKKVQKANRKNFAKDLLAYCQNRVSDTNILRFLQNQ